MEILASISRMTIFIALLFLHPQIVRQFNNTYATAYLLEKAGDIHGAFQLLLEVILLRHS